jgi:1-acyl-sn-glycerol-3-phosphate acyltransferase
LSSGFLENQPAQIRWLEDPKPLVARIKGWIGFTVTALFLFSTLFFFNFLQMVSLLVRPFSRTAFRRANTFLASIWWGWCAIGAERGYRIKMVFSGDPLPLRENAMVFANHQQMVDPLALLSLARRQNRIGDLKWFAKKQIKYAPGIGWGLRFLDCLFLQRNWESDRKMVERTFSKFIVEDIPLWLIAFSEGTRITPEKLAQSQAYATKQGLQVPRYTLVPRTKGFVAAVTALRSHFKAVYDVTIGYPEGIPKLGQYMKGYVHEIHFHVRRFPIDMLPPEEGLSAWLVERFQEKDLLMAYFWKQGEFPSRLPPLS